MPVAPGSQDYLFNCVWGNIKINEIRGGRISGERVGEGLCEGYLESKPSVTVVLVRGSFSSGKRTPPFSVAMRYHIAAQTLPQRTLQWKV